MYAPCAFLYRLLGAPVNNKPGSPPRFPPPFWRTGQRCPAPRDMHRFRRRPCDKITIGFFRRPMKHLGPKNHLVDEGSWPYSRAGGHKSPARRCGTGMNVSTFVMNSYAKAARNCRRINTYTKCCKQMTLSQFKINTYTKRGRGVPHFAKIRRNSPLSTACRFAQHRP